MLSFMDVLTDLQFFSIFIALLIATFAAEWILDVLGKRGKR
jgi:hypothetical protein